MITYVIEQNVTTDPVIREIVFGVIGTGIVTYLLNENRKLKERVKEVIDNHISDMNKFIKDKDSYMKSEKFTLDTYHKLIRDVINALNNTKKD